MSASKRRIIVEVPKIMYIEFKARCAEYDTTMSDVLRNHIKQYLITHPAIFPKEKTPKKEID